MGGYASSSSKKREKIILIKVHNWADKNKSWVAVLRPLPWWVQEQAFIIAWTQPTQTDLDAFLVWLKGAHDVSSGMPPLCLCVCARFCFQQPLLDFSLHLIYLATFSLSLPVLTHLSLSSHSSRHVSQQLLGSDGWYQQCKTLTCSLVTDYPRALLCCSLSAYQHTVHAQA